MLKPEGRPGRRGEDNIKMVLQEVVCGGTDCCECGNEPSCSIQCREFLDLLRTC